MLIQTLANAERVAEDALTAPYRRCPVYFPKIQVLRSHAGKVDVVERPFINRYAFVDDCNGYRVVRSAPGVSNIVSYASSHIGHAVQRAVCAIKAREVGGYVQLSDDVKRSLFRGLRQGFSKNEQVRVTRGPFVYWDGLFQTLISRDRASVLFNLLGGMRAVEVKLSDLEKV